jgi:hypothetical protein
MGFSIFWKIEKALQWWSALRDLGVKVRCLRRSLPIFFDADRYADHFQDSP